MRSGNEFRTGSSNRSKHQADSKPVVISVSSGLNAQFQHTENNSTLATTANPEEENLMKQLWPDQETYKKEEQRRFEILLAHWDLPVTDITPTAK